MKLVQHGLLQWIIRASAFLLSAKHERLPGGKKTKQLLFAETEKLVHYDSFKY